MCKLWLLLLFATVSLNCFSQDFFIERLNLKADIERADFFDYKITKFEFEKDEFELVYNYSNNRFNDIRTKLIIETNIPDTFVDSGYEINATEISSMCNKYGSGESIRDDYIEVFVDEFNLNYENVFSNSFSSSVSDSFYDFLDFRISFDEVDPEVIKSAQCKGRVSLFVGLVI